MNNSEAKELKIKNEIAAIERIRDLLGGPSGQLFYDYWFEFEQKNTYEAKVAHVHINWKHRFNIMKRI